MQNSISQKILKSGFGLAMLIFISMSAVSYENMKKLVEAYQGIEQSYQFQANIEGLISSLKDCDYRSRSDEANLEISNIVAEEINASIQNILYLSADNPVQEERLVELKKLIDKRLELLKKLSDLASHRVSPTQQQIILSNQGNKLMAQIRQLSQQSKKEEQELLEHYQGTVAHLVQNAMLINLLSPSLLACCVFLVYLLLASVKQTVTTTPIPLENHDVAIAKRCCGAQIAFIEPLRDQAGEVVGITGAAIDITKERVREKQLQAIFESTLEAIVIADDEGKYVEANPAACQLFGLSLSELLSKRISDFMEPGFNFELAWRNFQELGEVTGEMRLFRLDGTSVEVEYTSKSNFLPGRHLSVLRDITKRKQAQQLLQASEERLHIALLAAGMGTWDWNLLTDEVYWCANQEALFGMTTGSFDSKFKTFVASLHPEDRDHLLQAAKRTIEEGTDFDCEFRIILPSGQIRWLGSKGQVFYDETGRAIRMNGVNMNISARKQAEEELIRISKAVESASDAICIGDITGKSIYHNKSFLKLFEYSPDELNAIGSKTQLFVDPEIALEVQNSTMNGKSWSGEVVLRSRSGSQVLVALRADAIKDQVGKNLGFLAICRDITATKQAEKALRETRYLLEKIADTTPTLLYIYHLAADCNVYANRRCEDFFGCTQPEIQAMGGQFFKQFIHPEDLQNLGQHLAILLAAKKGEVVENELRMKNASGEWRWLQFWEVVFTRNTDGKPEQILGTAVDITERKRLEEIRCDLEAEKELRKMQLKFFSMASHEFRTPLSTILLSAQSLAQSYYRWPEEKIVKNLQRIQGCTKQMTHLLEDILTINRADTKKLEMSPKSCDLEKICRHLIQEAQLIYNHKKNITFVIQGQCQEVCLDETIIKSILDNLLSNALKYSPPKKNVNLTVVCTQFEAILQICDEGIGIPPEDLPRLFEPFQRGSNVGNIPGSGLGLTVVKKCLDFQGGKIYIKSDVDVGTQVTVMLPWMNCEV